jgi:hypothetical protein
MMQLPIYVFGTKISGQMVEIIIRFFADRSVFVLGINYSDRWTYKKHSPKEFLVEGWNISL